jgi:hypothetical protein
MQQAFNKGELVELVDQKRVRLKSDMNDSGHYLASLDIHDEWPEQAIGAIIYVHQTEIFQRLDEGQ